MRSVLAALVNGGILSAMVTIAVWLALRVTLRRVLNAATRYAVWWAALAIAVTLPALFLPRDVASAPPVEESGDSIVASPPANPPTSAHAGSYFRSKLPEGACLGGLSPRGS
jgi:beta-lactamase regulating signal transducer with metallopeptidase domain